jgi:mercuric ion binding protein
MRQLLIAVLATQALVALAAPAQTIRLDVQNMTCPICPITVKRSLEQLPGVSAVKVDLAEKMAIVTYDPDKANPEALIKATTQAGYPSSVHK